MSERGIIELAALLELFELKAVEVGFTGKLNRRCMRRAGLNDHLPRPVAAPGAPRVCRATGKRSAILQPAAQCETRASRLGAT